MQRQRFAPAGQIELPPEDYGFVRQYLFEKFGEVYRAGNDFWRTSGQTAMVASLINPSKLLIPGKNLLEPETIEVGKVVRELRQRGRRVKVYKVLHHCQSCLSFFVFPTAQSQHLTGDNQVHQVNPILEGSYTTYVPRLPPFEQRRGWIGKERLLLAFSKHVDPKTAEEMANLRINAFREGIGLSIQEIVEGKAEIPEIVRERTNAHRDAAEAKLCPPICTAKPTTPLPTVVPSAACAPIDVRRGPSTFLSSFIDWKVKVNGRELTSDQMIEAAVRLGIPYGLPRQAARTAHETQMDIEDTGKLPAFGEILYDADKDAGVLDDAEREVLTKFAKRDKRLAKALKNRPPYGRKKLTIADLTRDGGSPRYDVDTPSPEGPRPRTPSLQRRPRISSTQNRLSSEEEKQQREGQRQEFLARFNLTPAQVLFEKEDGLIKAAKTIATRFGTGRIEVFNTVFTHRLPAPDDKFGEQAEAVATELASELKGPVVVSEDRKRGMKSLAVVVDGKYTVRVATTRLLSSLPNEVR